MTAEIWKPVLNHEGSYEVSDHGRVRSLARVVPMSNGRARVMSGRVLSPAPDKDGYLCLVLSANGRRATEKVHRLVLGAFLGIPPTARQARHLDGDRTNNHLSNLAWGTAVDNYADRVTHGTAYIAGRNAGEKRRKVKRAANVWAIRQMAQLGIPRTEIAKCFGVDPSTISGVISGRKGYDRLAIFGPYVDSKPASQGVAK